MSELIKNTFDAVSDAYDDKALAFFPRSAASLTRRLCLAGDERVLDVATGTGHLALTIAGAIPGGRVVGIDFSRGMLESARKKAKKGDIRNIDFIEMDMQNLELEPGSFDVAVCAFAIFFVEDMQRQLKSISSKVRPGGKVAISTFEENHFFNPLVDLMIERIQKYGIEKPSQSWKQVGTEAGCTELFRSAGLTGIRVEYENVGYYLESVDEWWSILWNGGFRRLLDKLNAEDRERFRREHLAEIGKLRTDKGIWLDVGVLFTMGEKGS
jgi:ubiquinone/menaquinone biosynthesis C-methylase UbiE